ncbi:DNA-binding HTH domain containing protein [Perkinsela sp. CCAP 1560/4]|nr:DNA-binding HTH domain containing protein [Perkinsela sp. CCAP 1560/4]|eukprot:KNH03727.1 DNA-binding HTH domain containing protein [Perkinsela sp. CCAP 1560/4]
MLFNPTCHLDQTSVSNHVSCAQISFGSAITFKCLDVDVIPKVRIGWQSTFGIGIRSFISHRIMDIRWISYLVSGISRFEFQERVVTFSGWIYLNNISTDELGSNFYLPNGPRVNLAHDFLIGNFHDGVWDALHEDYHNGTHGEKLHIALRAHCLLEMNQSRYMLLQYHDNSVTWLSTCQRLFQNCILQHRNRRSVGGIILKLGNHPSILASLSLAEYLNVHEMLCRVSAEKYQRNHCLHRISQEIGDNSISMHLLSEEEFALAISDLHQVDTCAPSIYTMEGFGIWYHSLCESIKQIYLRRIEPPLHLASILLFGKLLSKISYPWICSRSRLKETIEALLRFLVT